MEANMKKYGKIIRQARLKMGLSQDQLAEKIYVTKQSISKYENNRSLPSEDIKEKLENLLNIKLLNGSDIHNIQIKRLIVFFSIAIGILSIGLGVAIYFAIYNHNLYHNSVLQFQELNDDYRSLISQNTLDFYGFSFTYGNDYAIENGHINIDMVIHNSTDTQYMVSAELFSINNLDEAASISIYDADSGAWWIGVGVIPNESFICTLRIEISNANNFFDETDYVDLYYADHFITRINLAT